MARASIVALELTTFTGRRFHSSSSARVARISFEITGIRRDCLHVRARPSSVCIGSQFPLPSALPAPLCGAVLVGFLFRATKASFTYTGLFRCLSGVRTRSSTAKDVLIADRRSPPKTVPPTTFGKNQHKSPTLPFLGGPIREAVPTRPCRPLESNEPHPTVPAPPDGHG